MLHKHGTDWAKIRSKIVSKLRLRVQWCFHKAAFGSRCVCVCVHLGHHFQKCLTGNSNDFLFCQNKSNFLYLYPFAKLIRVCQISQFIWQSKDRANAQPFITKPFCCSCWRSWNYSNRYSHTHILHQTCIGSADKTGYMNRAFCLHVGGSADNSWTV